MQQCKREHLSPVAGNWCYFVWFDGTKPIYGAGCTEVLKRSHTLKCSKCMEVLKALSRLHSKETFETSEHLGWSQVSYRTRHSQKQRSLTGPARGPVKDHSTNHFIKWIAVKKWNCHCCKITTRKITK